MQRYGQQASQSRRLSPNAYARDNAILQKQKNINRYVHAYFSDNAEVMMELEGINSMFSEQKIKPMPIHEYREYMKERKREAKAKDCKRK